MRILHTSDWHLGKKLETVSRYQEQKDFLEEICQIATKNKVDAILIAGDLFDTYNPSTEAIEIFYKYVKKMANNGATPVIAIAGNHDSPNLVEAPDPLARENGIFLCGHPNTIISPINLESGISIKNTDESYLEVHFPNYNFPLRIIHTAYANENRLKTDLGVNNPENELRYILEASWNKIVQEKCTTSGVNILLSHLFIIKEGMPSPDEPDDEKPILHVGGVQAVYTHNIPPQIQYTALGHLHRKQYIQREPHPVVYSGSPLSYSFAEANQDKFVLLIDAEPNKEVEITEVKLESGKKLLRKNASNMADAESWLNENKDCLVELSIETEAYLTADERKFLHKLHPGIITIIPQLKHSKTASGKTEQQIDLQKSINELFSEYFEHKMGQAPNDDLIGIFNEIMAEDSI